MTILIPVLNEILLVAGRRTNIGAVYLVCFGAHAEVLVSRVERVWTAGVVAQFVGLNRLLRRHEIYGRGIRCFRQIPHDIGPVPLQLILVIFLDLQTHSVVVED